MLLLLQINLQILQQFSENYFYNLKTYLNHSGPPTT